jgi:hypothetical protein
MKLRLAIIILISFFGTVYSTSYAPNAIEYIYSPNNKFYLKCTPDNPDDHDGITEAFETDSKKKLWEIDGYYLACGISNDGKSYYRRYMELLFFYSNGILINEYDLTKLITNKTNVSAYHTSEGMTPLFMYDSTQFRMRLDNSWIDTIKSEELRQFFFEAYPELDIPYYNKAKGKNAEEMDSLVVQFSLEAAEIFDHQFRFDGKFLSLITAERVYYKFDVHTGNVVYESLWENIDSSRLVYSKKGRETKRKSEEVGWFEPLFMNEKQLTQFVNKKLKLYRTVWYDPDRKEEFYISKVAIDKNGKVLDCVTLIHINHPRRPINYLFVGKDNYCSRISRFLLKQEFIVKDIIEKQDVYNKEIMVHIK